MRFEIEWQAIVGRFKLNVNSVERIEAPSSSAALNLMRTSIITKLNSLNAPFFITGLKFLNIKAPISISLIDQHNFLTSINAEGGLAVNLPKSPPAGFIIEKDGAGGIRVTPNQITPPA